MLYCALLCLDCPGGWLMHNLSVFHGSLGCRLLAVLRSQCSAGMFCADACSMCFRGCKVLGYRTLQAPYLLKSLSETLLTLSRKCADLLVRYKFAPAWVRLGFQKNWVRLSCEQSQAFGVCTFDATASVTHRCAPSTMLKSYAKNMNTLCF